MGIEFDVKDIIHKITAKFVHNLRPGAKKPYNLRAVHQPELDIHGIASKAEMYNITVSPKVIEEGMNAGLMLIRYLTADGYKIRTPMFKLRMKIPGEYDGSESRLPGGIFPELRLQATEDFRNYIRDKVEIVISGVDNRDGYIGRVHDEAADATNAAVTKGGFITIHGWGLKIDGKAANKAETGLYFDPPSGAGAGSVKADIIAVNEPKTIKAVVPTGLISGETYTLRIVTQTSAKNATVLIKDLRTLSSDIPLQVN